MYALARTWYAPEMPRPGCVWTHTLLIPNSCLVAPCLDIFLSFFRRPQKGSSQGAYGSSIPIPALEADAGQQGFLVDQHPVASRFLNLFYGEPSRPVLIPAKSSSEYEQMIFAFWSQQWPSTSTAFLVLNRVSRRSTFGRTPT